MLLMVMLLDKSWVLTLKVYRLLLIFEWVSIPWILAMGIARLWLLMFKLLRISQIVLSVSWNFILNKSWLLLVVVFWIRIWVS